MGGETELLEYVALSYARQGCSLVLDLAEVVAMDARGLGLMLDLTTQTWGRGGHLRLIDKTGRMRELLRLMNPSRLIMEMIMTRVAFQTE